MRCLYVIEDGARGDLRDVGEAVGARWEGGLNSDSRGRGRLYDARQEAGSARGRWPHARAGVDVWDDGCGEGEDASGVLNPQERARE